MHLGILPRTVEYARLSMEAENADDPIIFYITPDFFFSSRALFFHVARFLGWSFNCSSRVFLALSFAISATNSSCKGSPKPKPRNIKSFSEVFVGSV